MPRKYYNYYPEPGQENSFGGGFNRVFGASLQNSLERNLNQSMKDKETAQTVDFEFRKQGLIPSEEAKTMGIDVTNPNLKRLKYKDTEWVEPITPYEQSKRDYETKKQDLDTKEKMANIAKLESFESESEKDRQNKLELIKNKPKPVNRPLQTQIAKTQMALADANAMAKTEIPVLKSMIDLNENSYGGMLGDLKYKATSMAGGGEKDVIFQNTAKVINNMQNLVAKILKSTFGGQLSEGEREYLNKVMGALPKMSKTERKIAIEGVINTVSGNASKAQSKLEELNMYLEPTEEIDEDPAGLFTIK